MFCKFFSLSFFHVVRLVDLFFSQNFNCFLSYEFLFSLFIAPGTLLCVGFVAVVVVSKKKLVNL